MSGTNNNSPYGDLSSSSKSTTSTGNASPYGDLTAPSKPVVTKPKVVTPVAPLKTPASSGTDVRSGVSAPAPQGENGGGFHSQMSIGQQVVGTIQTPLNFMADLAYRLATPSSAAEHRRMDASIQKNGYLGWLASEWATSAKNATAWQRGGEVKHTGEAVAKNLGLINPNKDFWATVQNIATGVAFDTALDPVTYLTAGVPVGTILKGATRAAGAIIKAAPEAAIAGRVSVGQAAKHLSAEELAKLPTETKYYKNTGINPKNLTGDITSQGIQWHYEKQFAKNQAKGTFVKLPNDVALERTMGQKAYEGIATSLRAGTDAMRQTMLTHNANRFLEQWAKKSGKITSDYIYHTGEAAAQQAETPTIPKPSEANVVAPELATRSHVPFPEHKPTKFEAAVTSVGSKDAKEIKSTLSYIDNIAKKVVGTQATGKTVSETVSRLIQNIDTTSTKIFSALKPELQGAVNDAIKLNDFNPKALFEEFLSRAETDRVSKAFASSYGNRVVNFSTGRAKIGEFLKQNRNTPFQKLQADDRLALVSALKEYTVDASPRILDELTKTVKDPQLVKELVDAGALTHAGRAQNIGVIKDILNRVATSPANTEKARYTGIDNLISGLRSGDIVSGESLMKIVKKLDPENSVVAKLEASGTKPSSEMMAEILKGENKATQTLEQMRIRFNRANTEVMLNATGIGMADTVAAVLDADLLGTLELPPQIFAASREFASRAVYEMAPRDLSDATDILQTTFAQQFGDAAVAASKKGASDRISVLGDHAILGATKPFTGAEAILPDQTGTAFTRIVSLKALGQGTKRVGAKVAKMAEAEAETFSTSTAKAESFIVRMNNIANILLSTTGSRFFIQKSVKGLGGDVANAHRVFLHTGDIVSKFLKIQEPGDTFIQDAMFPVGNGFNQFDGFEVESVLNTVRQVLEDRQLKNPHKLDELFATLTRRQAKNTVSDKFLSQQTELAQEFIRRLVTKVAPELEQVHLNNASAAVLDHSPRSMDLSGQIIGEFKKAWEAAYKTGWTTPEERFQAVKAMFMRFAYNADIIRQTDGRVAEAVMRAASMVMVKSGKLAVGDGEPLSEFYKLFPEKGTQDYADMWEIINTYARRDNPMLAAPKGSERLPRPSDVQVAKAEAKLQNAMDAVEAHVAKGKNLTTKEEYKQWRSDGTKIARFLDQARYGAYRAWIPTKHWSNITESWVSTEQYDHAAELLWREQTPKVLIGDEMVNVAEHTVDSAPVPREGAGNGGQVAANKAARNKAVKTRQVQMAQAHGDDAAAEIVANVGKFDELGLPADETAIRLYDSVAYEQYDRAIPKANVFAYSMERATSKAQGFIERMSQTGGRHYVQGFLQNAESQVHVVRSDLARATQHLYKQYKDLPKEDFLKAFNSALRHEPVDTTASETVQKLQLSLNAIIDPMLRDAELSSLDSNAFKRALARYGLDDATGFKFGEDGLQGMLEKAPFGENPYDPATAEYIQYKDRQDAFNKVMHPLLAVVKVGTAIQHVKSLQALAANLVDNVGYKAYGYTHEQAIKNGFVSLAVKEGQASELLSVMPGIEDGALFHPSIAEQIGSLDREYTRLLSSSQYNKVIGALMQMTSYLKFAQTGINPRHHSVNIMGEYGAELLRGNLNPENWSAAKDVASEIGMMMFKTDYRKDKLALATDRFIGSLGLPENAGELLHQYTKNGSRQFLPIIAGKQRVITRADLARIAMRTNIATSSLLNDEGGSFYETVLKDTFTSGPRRQLAKSALTRLHLGIQNKLMRPVGDATAIYTNVPRLAGAIEEMMSRPWKSEQEMIAAMAARTHLYHPTVQSLASAERKYARVAIGYYTWLRVAHSAMIDMLHNHAFGLTVGPKIFNNIREAQGIEQQNPANPWDQNLVIPQNMRGSVYGPIADSPSGIVAAKPSIWTMDIMDQWQWYTDPFVGDVNPDYVQGKNWEKLTDYLMGSSNPILRQIFQELVHKDFSTGAQFYDNSWSAIVDRAFQLLGPYQALKAVDLVTPVGKTVTPEQRFVAGLNWLTGMKFSLPMQAGIQGAGKKEDSARLKAIVDGINKGQNK